jgi:hypothetical protein
MQSRKSKNRRLHFVALLGNVNHSILGVNCDYFKIEQWTRERGIKLFCKLTNLPESEVDFYLDSEWGYDYLVTRKASYIYVLRKDFLWPSLIDLDERLESTATTHAPSDDYLKNERKLSLESNKVNDILTKLRLWKDGSVRVPISAFYYIYANQVILVSMSQDLLHSENRLYHLENKELRPLNQFLKRSLSPKQPYLQLALETFEQTFRVPHNELEFLSLMICLEALLNDGTSELRYKLARGAAVLLGESRLDAETIFKNVKQLYDKRSTLVHTGSRRSLTTTDTFLLRSYVRRMLRKLVLLDRKKEDITAALTCLGFGEDNRSLFNS